MRRWAAGAFRSLRLYNFRVWTAGSLVSNVGSWMQRIAQDWLVLTQLTDQSASAVGIVTALQFAPQFLLLPWTGWAADTFNQRKLMMVTQAAMAVLAFGLGVLTVTGVVELWHVYGFALLLGCVSAFDAPVRQAFVSAMVSDADIANDVALNSMSFNGARMVGPAVAGIAIATIGTGWAFIANGVSFLAVLVSLAMLRVHELLPNARAVRKAGNFREGLLYVWNRDDLRVNMIMLFLIGTFGMNFAIWTSTMAVSVFHTDAHGYGVLSSMMAVGTVAGALLAAGRDQPRFIHLIVGTAMFGVGCLMGVLSPGYWFFAAALFVCGISVLTFLNSSNALTQLTTEASLRGRVMAIRMAITLGGTPFAAPFVGWAADRYGPRWSMAIGVAAGVAAALVGLHYWLRRKSRPERKPVPVIAPPPEEEVSR